MGTQIRRVNSSMFSTDEKCFTNTSDVLEILRDGREPLLQSLNSFCFFTLRVCNDMSSSSSGRFAYSNFKSISYHHHIQMQSENKNNSVLSP